MQSTEGIYGRLKDETDDLAEQIPRAELDKCKLGYIRKRRVETFIKDMRSARPPLKDERYLRQLLLKVEQSVNGKFEM